MAVKPTAEQLEESFAFEVRMVYGVDIGELDEFFAIAAMPERDRAMAQEDRRHAVAAYVNGNNLEHAWEIIRRLMTVRAAFKRVDRLGKAEAVRKKQVDEMQDKGAAARRIYTPGDRERWQALFAAELSKHSKRRAAELIAERESLPEEAVETIRKALTQKAGKPL